MKSKLCIYGAALAALIAQGCSKGNQSSLNQKTSSSKMKADATSAYQDNAVTGFFQRTSGAEAFDGAFSVRLTDGSDIWLNSDTFYNQLNGNGMLPCIFNVHNSVLQQPSSHSWTPSNTPTLTYLGNAAMFVPLNSSHWFWLGGGFQVGGNPYILCNEMETASGGLGFTQVSQILGQLDMSTHAVTYTSLPNLNGISFGVGFVPALDGNVYAYGYKPQGGISVASNIYVARFPYGNVGAWTFWNGSSWVSSASSAAVIGVAESNGVYVQWVNTKLVMVSTAFSVQCDQGSSIYACTSSSMTGPFTTQQVIYNIPDRNQGHTPFFYTPAIHPQFNANNEFLMTYCINYYQPCVTACINNQMDPNGYRPRGVRVPFSVLGL